MEHIEGNKIIAEFMGLPCPPIYDDYSDDGENPTGRGFYANDLEYHTSWDWLMPVVEKIGKMDEPFLERMPVAELSIFAPIKDVCDKVIQFIQWYNKQNPNP